jgi:hypothetical protein
MKFRLHPDWVRFTLGEIICCALLRILPDDKESVGSTGQVECYASKGKVAL